MVNRKRLLITIAVPISLIVIGVLSFWYFIENDVLRLMGGFLALVGILTLNVLVFLISYLYFEEKLRQ